MPSSVGNGAVRAVTSGAKLVAFLLLLGVGVLSGCDGRDLSAVVDLSGRPVDPFDGVDTKATVVVFVDTDCPISNRYAPALRRLYETYSARGVRFWLVYPDSDLSPAEIRRHLTEYRYPMDALRDPEHQLVRLAKARVTPEAAVFLPDAKLLYHGRIDDRYVDFNQRRPTPTHRDVEEVLDAVLLGRPVSATATLAGGRPLSAASSPGVGCFLADLK